MWLLLLECLTSQQVWSSYLLLFYIALHVTTPDKTHRHSRFLFVEAVDLLVGNARFPITAIFAIIFSVAQDFWVGTAGARQHTGSAPTGARKSNIIPAMRLPAISFPAPPPPNASSQA